MIIDEGIARAGKLEQGKAGVLQAELYLLRARILLQQNRNSEADKYLALAEAQAANTTENDSADAIALLVEIRTAMFTTRGLGYIISNGGTIEMLLKKAIEKDPDNVRAIILQANSELYKPFGSLDSSITLFDRALKLSGITKQQRFVALLGLAEAWNKKWNADKRKEYLKTAKEYYPNNPIMKKALKEAGL